jgi:dihydroneopterin aldolase
VDEIQLRGLRVTGTHGVLPEEQVRAQPFEVDVDLSADLASAGSSDSLDDTVDYGAVVSSVAEVVGSERFALLEALAERLCAVVLGLDGRVVSVTVTVRKLRPPVAVDLAYAAVRVSRSR